MNTQSISLDVSKEPAITPVLYLGQGDKNGTIIEATIYDNGVPLTLTNYSVRFEMRLPDHTSYYRSPNGTVSGNVATIPIDETYAASVDGQTCIAYVVVFSGSNTICSTNRINIIVLESAEEGADAAHAYESGIIEATAAANAAAQSANNAAANASTAATSATTAAGNASTQATAAQTAASSANTAASNADQQAAAAQRNADAASTAAAAATSSAERANDATTRANAAIDAMGDISELAVPLMTKDTRGGAKLGNSLQLVDERLNVKLTASGSGRSVATETAEALAALTIHGESIQDGTPAPDNPQEIRVARGRNLLNAIEQGALDSNGMSISSSMRLRSVGYIPVVGGVTYSVSANNSKNKSVQFSLNWYTADDFQTARISSSGWFTTHTTAPSDALFARLLMSFTDSSDIAPSDVFSVQLEAGSTPTPYVPYGSIGVITGDTVTPIDLQGNVIASLPDGTKDVLSVDATGHVTLEKNVGKYVFDGAGTSWTVAGIGVYVNSSAITDSRAATYGLFNDHYNDRVISSTNNEQYNLCADHLAAGGSTRFMNTSIYPQTSAAFNAALAASPVTAYYPLATSQTIDLGYIDMPAIESGDAISVSASIVPVIDATWWERGAGAVADAIKAIMAALEARTGELAEAIADITNG